MRTVAILFMWIFREAHLKVVNVHVDVNTGSQLQLGASDEVGLPETPVLQSPRRSRINLSCPEVGYDFNGDDVLQIPDIKSWRICGLLCNATC